MPVHVCHTVQSGTTGRSVFLFAHSPEGRALSGLAVDLAKAAFVRLGEPATAIDVTAGGVGDHSSGSITEVDPEFVPGVYRFDVPDEALAAGTTEVVLIVEVPGAVIEPIRFNLVAYDPQDAWSLGMTQLQDYKRHQVLRQALPRFTEMELSLGAQNEQRLADQLGESLPGWAREENA